MQWLRNLLGGRKRAGSASILDTINDLISQSLVLIGTPYWIELNAIAECANLEEASRSRVRWSLFSVWCARRAVFSIAQGHKSETEVGLLGELLTAERAVFLAAPAKIPLSEIWAAFHELDVALATDAEPGYPSWVGSRALKFVFPTSQRATALADFAFRSKQDVLLLHTPFQASLATLKMANEVLKPIAWGKPELLRIERGTFVEESLIRRWNVFTNTDVSFEQFELTGDSAGRLALRLHRPDSAPLDRAPGFDGGSCADESEAFERVTNYLSDMLIVMGLSKLPCSQFVIFDTTNTPSALAGWLQYDKGTVAEQRF